MKKPLVPHLWRPLLLAACCLFTFVALGPSAAAAESTGAEADRSIFYGEVTAVDGNGITIAIATLDFQGGFRQRGNGDGTFTGQNSVPDGDTPSSTTQPDGGAPQSLTPGGGRMNFAGNLTFTGESVTGQITGDIVLTKQAWDMGASNPPDTATNDGGQGNNPTNPQRPQGAMPMGQRFGFMGEEAFLEDITVGCIVVLTYRTSTQTLLSIHIISSPQSAGE